MDPLNLQKLSRIEQATEELSQLQNQIASLEEKQSVNKEYLAHTSISSTVTPKQNAQPCWVTMGGLFVSLPQSKVKTLIQQDQREILAELKDARSKIRELAAFLKSQGLTKTIDTK